MTEDTYFVLTHAALLIDGAAQAHREVFMDPDSDDDKAILADMKHTAKQLRRLAALALLE